MSQKDLEAQIKALQYTLRTFIAWTAQSACAPINRKEAETLFAMLEPRPSPGPEAGE
jgi:hypothetical protein